LCKSRPTFCCSSGSDKAGHRGLVSIGHNSHRHLEALERCPRLPSFRVIILPSRFRSFVFRTGRCSKKKVPVQTILDRFFNPGHRPGYAQPSQTDLSLFVAAFFVSAESARGVLGVVVVDPPADTLGNLIDSRKRAGLLDEKRQLT